MRALSLLADRKLELTDIPSPAAPAAGEVQIRVKAVALNHLDLWGYRGMAFAKRKMPVVVGVEAAAPARPAARAATICARTSAASWASTSTASRATSSTCRHGW
jgi:alcohol dehydrogenase